MKNNRMKKILQNASIFDELTDNELNEIVQLSHEQTFDAGATVFTEGEIAKELYIIKEGKIVLEMSIRLGIGVGKQSSIDVLTNGQVFGWSAVAESNTFTMTAKCIEKSRVIVLDRARLWRLFEENSDLGFKVMKKIINVVSFRLRRSRDTQAHILSIASHDLRSPLAAVVSYLRLMLEGVSGELDETQRGMLQKSVTRLSGLITLIDDILDISRIDTKQLEIIEISLADVVEEPIVIAKRLAEEKGIAFDVAMPQALPGIFGAPDRLKQVFINLLSNAVKFTSEGGSVTLSIVEERDHILNEVMDTGIGISSKDLPKIFDDFYRSVHTESAGAGLGLSIAKKIIEAHGGRIWAESPCPLTGVGSRFSFTLPKKLTGIQVEQ